MARSQCHEFFALGVEEWISGDDERTNPLVDEGCEGSAELEFGGGIHDMYPQPKRACCHTQVCCHSLAIRIAWVREHTHSNGFWHKLMQELQLLGLYCNGEQAHARGITSGMVEAGDKAQLDRVAGYNEDNGGRCGRRLSGKSRGRTPGCSDYRYIATNQTGSELRQTVVPALGPAVFDDDVPALKISSVREAPAERANDGRRLVWRTTAKKPNHRHRWLLRACRKRPTCRSAAE